MDVHNFSRIFELMIISKLLYHLFFPLDHLAEVGSQLSLQLVQSVILSLWWHIFYAHSKICHLQVLIINELIFSLDENVEQTDVQDNPKANHEV